MALERGTRLGLYQIDAPIGAGGMGVVYVHRSVTILVQGSEVRSQE